MDKIKIVKDVPKELKEFIKPALDEFKREVMRDLGLSGSENESCKGLSREDRGRIGGEMVKRMVLFGKCVLAWRYREMVRERINLKNG